MAVVVGGAVALTLLTTPLYQASTRLVVSSNSSDVYAGTLSSQQRVVSYAKLLTGETLAQRTIDKLHLDMSADELRARVKASAAPVTVLIDVSVHDPSPVKARDIANALSDEFVVMVREIETPEEGGKPGARVVVEQHASLPTKPVIPNTTRNVSIGLALGLLLGIGLAVLRDRFDHTIKDQEILEQTSGVGVVANIPFDKDLQKDPAISFAEDRSPTAEVFRELRTNLSYLEVDDPPRVLVVTSSVPREGKTTTAINIALALAEAEHNVVLVDGDLRWPKLDTYLNLIGSIGFSTVLAGRALLHEVLQKTNVPGLTVLTSGAIPRNPSALLGSLATKKVLSEMRSGFDYVIVDSSPLLPVTDAAILAAAADGVLVVVHFAETKREQVTHAVGNLRKVEARILGAVLTMVPARGNVYGVYNYYRDVDTPNGTSPRRRPRRSLRLKKKG
jgi:receptor protein-tyrosine kinase